MEIIITFIFSLLSIIYVFIKCLCKRPTPNQSNQIIKPIIKRLTDSQIKRNKDKIEGKRKQKDLEETYIKYILLSYI